MPIFLAGEICTLLSGTAVIWKQDTTLNPSKSFPGVAPPGCLPKPRCKHNASKMQTTMRWIISSKTKSLVKSNKSCAAWMSKSAVPPAAAVQNDMSYLSKSTRLNQSTATNVMTSFKIKRMKKSMISATTRFHNGGIVNSCHSSSGVGFGVAGVASDLGCWFSWDWRLEEVSRRKDYEISQILGLQHSEQKSVKIFGKWKGETDFLGSDKKKREKFREMKRRTISRVFWDKRKMTQFDVTVTFCAF